MIKTAIPIILTAHLVPSRNSFHSGVDRALIPGDWRRALQPAHSPLLPPQHQSNKNNSQKLK